eukprot:4869909-Pyramimonas_sp.AAC.1
MSYHRSDANAFDEQWKQFKAPRYHSDFWPDNFTASEQKQMDAEYRVLPEHFYHRSRPPMISPYNVDDFIKHMETFQQSMKPLQLEVCSGAGGASIEVHANQYSDLPPIDYIYGWDLHRDEHREAWKRIVHAFRPRHTLCEFLCRPWSQSTNRSDPRELEQRRQAERPMLD